MASSRYASGLASRHAQAASTADTCRRAVRSTSDASPQATPSANGYCAAISSVGRPARRRSRRAGRRSARAGRPAV
jgi:hypothetical protein